MSFRKVIDTAVGFFSNTEESKGKEAVSLTLPLAQPVLKIPKEINKFSLVDTPHFYQLSHSILDKSEMKETSRLLFFVFGCAGDGKLAQKKVAEAMAGAKVKPAFIIVLGDNFYDHGVDSSLDPVFEERFHQVYSICGVPCFIIPGNHDYNLCRTGLTGGVIDKDKIAAQVLHTFLDRDNKEINLEKIKRYQEEKLDLATLPLWNMPSRFNVLRKDNVKLFLFDSNTYLADYLELLKKRERVEKKEPQEEKPGIINQAEYMERIYKEHPSPVNFAFTHHPLYTIGKRSEIGDQDHYLSPLMIAELKERGITGTYNIMLRQAFEKQELHFDAVFSAHDHFNYLYTESATAETKSLFTQVVAGGGGGEPQDRVEFKTAPQVPYWEKGEKINTNGYGYVDVSVDFDHFTKKIMLGFNNTQGNRYQFSPGSTVAHREINPEEDEHLTFFREFILKICDDYLKIGKIKWPGSFLMKIPYLITVPEDLTAVGYIKNYFNEFQSKTLEQYIRKIKDESPPLFSALIHEKLKETSYHTLDKFIEISFLKQSLHNQLKKMELSAIILETTAENFLSGTSKDKEEKSSVLSEENFLTRSPPRAIAKVETKESEFIGTRFSPGSPRFFTRCIDQHIKQLDGSLTSAFSREKDELRLAPA